MNRLIFTIAVSLYLWAANLWAADGLHEMARFEGKSVTRISIEGRRFTREFIIYRELQTAPGRPLGLAELRVDLQRLKNLDIFSSVAATGVEDGGGVIVTLRVREMPFAVPYISYEVNDQDGLSLGPAIRSVNMMGRDIFVAGFALFGGSTRYLLCVRDPWVAANHLSLGLDLVRIERYNELDGFGQTSFELSPRLRTYLGQRGRAGVGMTFLRVSSEESGHTLSPSGKDDNFRLVGSVGYDSRDSWSDPHRGWKNQLEAIKSGGLLPGNGDFWTANLDLRRYQPVGSHTLVLAGLLSLQTGTVGKSLPEYLDFHLGGTNTIRGYGVKTLGGEAQGKHQLLTTLEYRVSLVRPREIVFLGQAAGVGLSWAVFTDSGIAWDRSDEFSRGRVKAGFGIGLRLLLPAVEMTRLDLARGEDGTWRIAFATLSKMDAQRLWLR